MELRDGMSDPNKTAAACRFLNSREITMIDNALAALGEFGELRLVVQRGRLRYLITQRSLDALKWRPGEPTESAGPVG